MIISAFSFLSLLLVLAGGLKLVEDKSQLKIFTVLPAIVMLYFLVMLMSTFGVWQKTAEINDIYHSLKVNVLPAMIFLMLLKADIRQIKKLGFKVVFAFLMASISIVISFVIAYLLFQPFLAVGAWKTLAALSGSWMGGTGNMAAVQMALNVPDSSMGYTLLIDSIDYAMWVMLLLALVPYAKHFNQWVGTNSDKLDEISAILSEKEVNDADNKTSSLLFLLGLSFLVSVISQHVAQLLPATAFFTQTTWTILFVTGIAILAAMTRMRNMFGSTELSNIMLYLIVGLIASRANFAELIQAPTYILMGLVILLLHGLMMVLCAKIFKIDLFTCGLASLANIGGVASAPILAAAYSRALIPVGVLMAMLGYIIGTGGGLLVGKLLLLVTH